MIMVSTLMGPIVMRAMMAASYIGVKLQFTGQ